MVATIPVDGKGAAEQIFRYALLSSGLEPFARKIPAGRDAKDHVNSANAGLKSQLSAVLRDQLLGELKEANSVDAAAIWARRVLPAKNSLLVADARQLENAFQARRAELELGADNAEPRPSSFGSIRKLTSPWSGTDRSRPELPLSRGSKKSGPARPEPRRVRDREHVKFVAGQPCLVCGRRPADPHDLRFAQSRALGRKVSDDFTVPLCRGHHRELYRCGDEAAW